MSPRFEARRNLYMAGIDSEVMVSHHKPWIHLKLLAAQGWICELHEESSDRGLHVQRGRERSWCAASIQNRGEWEWWGGYWPLRRWMWLGKNRILFLLSLDWICNFLRIGQIHHEWNCYSRGCTSQAWPLRAQQVRWICKSSFITCSRWPKRSTPGSATIGPGCCEQLGTSAVEMGEDWWREKGADRGPVLRNEGSPSFTRLFES